MQEYIQIKEVIQDIKQLIRAMQLKRIGKSDIQNVQLTANEINRILYHWDKLRFQRNIYLILGK